MAGKYKEEFGYSQESVKRQTAEILRSYTLALGINTSNISRPKWMSDCDTVLVCFDILLYSLHRMYFLYVIEPLLMIMIKGLLILAFVFDPPYKKVAKSVIYAGPLYCPS